MMSGGTEQPVRVFHACTKGLEDRLLFMDESDYICATRIAAVTAYRHQVKIAAYCLMTNHVHFMVCADEKKCVSDFMTDFKKDYSRHYMRRYNSSKVLKRIEVTVKEMEDISYIRNCVSYILRNPVDGGLVKDTGQYRWSSVACYYSRNRNSDGMPASFSKADWQGKFFILILTCQKVDSQLMTIIILFRRHLYVLDLLKVCSAIHRNFSGTVSPRWIPIKWNLSWYSADMLSIMIMNLCIELKP